LYLISLSWKYLGNFHSSPHFSSPNSDPLFIIIWLHIYQFARRLFLHYIVGSLGKYPISQSSSHNMIDTDLSCRNLTFEISQESVSSVNHAFLEALPSCQLYPLALLPLSFSNQYPLLHSVLLTILMIFLTQIVEQIILFLLFLSHRTAWIFSQVVTHGSPSFNFFHPNSYIKKVVNPSIDNKVTTRRKLQNPHKYYSSMRLISLLYIFHSSVRFSLDSQNISGQLLLIQSQLLLLKFWNNWSPPKIELLVYEIQVALIWSAAGPNVSFQHNPSIVIFIRSKLV
jgi:hypothetical protein